MTLVFLSQRKLPETVAIVLRPKGRYRVPSGVSLTSNLGWSQMDLRWRTSEVWKLPTEPLLRSEDPGLMPWVPLTHYSGPPERALRRCRDIIDRNARPEERANLLAVSQVLARLRYNDPGVFEIPGGRRIMIESPLIQELVAEKLQNSILRFLLVRFESVPISVEEKLRRIQDENRLNALIDTAARCTSLDSFRSQVEQS
jgi:hypothetical protein